MEMEKELDEIVAKQEQLRAMERSLMDFAHKLKDQQDRFLVNYLNYKKDEKQVNMFDAIKRATDPKRPRLII